MSGCRSTGRPLLVLLSISLLCLAMGGTARGQPHASASALALEALLPDTTVVVEILRPDYSQEIEDIAVRMHAAARRDPGWFHSYLARHPGTPPWHSKLGVSIEDYQRYLLASRSTPVSVQQRARLTFRRDGARRRWILSGWGLLSPLSNVVIDLDRDQVMGRFGPLPWKGVSWPAKGKPTSLDWQWFGEFVSSHVVGDPRAGGKALQNTLSLGPIGDGSTVGLYWTVRRLGMGARFDDQFLLLRFARPRSR